MIGQNKNTSKTAPTTREGLGALSRDYIGMKGF